MAVIEAIATQYLEADVSSVTFSSIPQTYEHLQLRYTMALAGTDNSYQMIFMGDGSADEGSNYSAHVSSGHETSVGGWTTTASDRGFYGGQAVGSVDRAWYGPVILDILDYASTTKNTTGLIINWDGGTYLGADWMIFTSGLWDSTAAVDTILIKNRYGTNINRGSELTLYGLNSS